VILPIAGCSTAEREHVIVSETLAIEATGTVQVPDATVRSLVILYSNDEHGWMEGTAEGRGAAHMMGLWREKEGYSEDGPYLILSGGDMWTGPAISSWFDGESMADVMNVMGYDAAAIGNHEFDWGIEGLRDRAAQSEFPFLSANIRNQKTGDPPGFAVPFVVQEVNGIPVGLIGLTTTSAPQTTMPDHVSELEFFSYQEALEEAVPQVRAGGAELLVVIGHICSDEMEWLVPTAVELGIAVIGGGHCHERVGRVVDGVALVEGGSQLQGYVRVDIAFDTATNTVVDIKAQYRSNSGGTSDPEVAAVVARWRARADESLIEVIGYLEQPIPIRSHAMINLVTNAWLEAYPAADVALTNRGGFRQAIPAGEITLETLIGVLPFNNVLIDVELTGAELIRNIECCGPVAGGMTTAGRHTLSDGTPVDPDVTYHVLVNDFMYAGGDGFKFREQDPDAYNTSIDWRQPVIDWISSLSTSPDDPLDRYLDMENRQW
jgi:2',3'-cyclic-nucleotide 2'-phosphodiesterase (5'-nucleotidase family)